jgi:hypothetical protein
MQGTTARSRHWPRTVEIDGVSYRVSPGPDRGEFHVDRDGAPWAFVRRGDEGQWVANDVHGWISPSLIERIMSEAR